MPSLPQMRKIHGELLELLKRFDALCSENDIRYTLDGGTLLGAVREKGFIPWDDDADVALERSEYEKLRDECRKGSMPEYMTFHENTAQRPHVWLRRPGKPGAWIDLFIFDYITEQPALAKLRMLGCAFFLVFTKTRESLDISKKAGLHKGLKTRLMSLGYWLGRPFSPRMKARMQNWFLKHAWHGRRRRVHFGNENYDYIDRVFPAEMLSGYQRVPFEDTELMILSDYQRLLTAFYGKNYMTPVRWASHDNAAHEGYMEETEEQGKC